MSISMNFDAAGYAYCERMAEPGILATHSANSPIKVAGNLVPKMNVEFHKPIGFIGFRRFLGFGLNFALAKTYKKPVLWGYEKNELRQEVLTKFTTLQSASLASREEHLENFRRMNHLESLPPKSDVLNALYDKKVEFFNGIDNDITRQAKKIDQFIDLRQNDFAVDVIYPKKDFEKIIDRLQNPFIHMPYFNELKPTNVK